MLDMTRIPGLGSKKAMALYDGLGVDTVAKLKAACERGEVAKLKGFGGKTEQKILEGIGFLDTVGKRVRFDQAFGLAPQPRRPALCSTMLWPSRAIRGRSVR